MRPHWDTTHPYVQRPHSVGAPGLFDPRQASGLLDGLPWGRGGGVPAALVSPEWPRSARAAMQVGQREAEKLPLGEGEGSGHNKETDSHAGVAEVCGKNESSTRAVRRRTSVWCWFCCHTSHSSGLGCRGGHTELGEERPGL